ncbi:hypothetical protein [Nonomuraea sp. bgisy101]|uniref:hypothetical protein n=1 Tax=Nonomuraea sp. bgisy101 TaxID=3413784 RepID=UPI003D7645BD
MTDMDQVPAEFIEGLRGHIAELDALGVRHLVGPGEMRVPYAPPAAYGIDLPVLAVAVGNLWMPETLPRGREWIAVSHDGQDLVSVVEPAPGVEEGMRRLCDLYAGTGLRRPTVDLLVEYRERLRELLGVDCEPHLTTFAEGWYPILPSELGALTGDPFELPEGAKLVVLGPLLVLGIGYGHLGSTRLPEREWYAVWHKDSGPLVVTAVEPTPEAAKGLRRLAREYPARRFRGHDVTLDDRVAYRDRLRELVGVESSDGLAALRTGLCPIDVNELRRLTADAVADEERGDGWEVFLLT